jgi:hypothetical protein
LPRKIYKYLLGDTVMCKQHQTLFIIRHRWSDTSPIYELDSDLHEGGRAVLYSKEKDAPPCGPHVHGKLGHMYVPEKLLHKFEKNEKGEVIIDLRWIQ